MTIAPYTDNDLPGVLGLWNAALPLDAMTAGMFTSRILLDANFDPSTFLLAKEGSRLTGFALGIRGHRMALGDADPHGTRAWILGMGVDPRHDLRSIGGDLLRELERTFKALGKNECYVSTYPPAYITPGIDTTNYRPVLDLLLAGGYTVEKEALSMDAPIVLFQVPETTRQNQEKLSASGIEVRTFRQADLGRFLDFLERSMPSDWVRVERRNLQSMSTGQFTSDQITVVARGDEIIGYCQFEGSHFGPFGVAEQYQGQGIGTVLLARTLERMRHMGYHNAWVMWTDDVAAKVYRKFGFTETRRFAILRKALS